MTPLICAAWSSEHRVHPSPEPENGIKRRLLDPLAQLRVETIGLGLRELVAKRRLGVRTAEAASITEVLHLRLPASWSNPAR
jgi:hypothetical protein